MNSSSIDSIPLATHVIFQGLRETVDYSGHQKSVCSMKDKGLTSFQDRGQIECNFRILGRKFGCDSETYNKRSNMVAG
jgi:hypothetical protein